MGIITTEFINEHQNIYNIKEFEECIYMMNDFCGKWDGIAEIEHIPYFLRLYCDEAMTLEQNDFITCVIDSIVKKNPERAMEIILNNYNILVEEDSEGCITHLVGILILHNETNNPLFAHILAKSNKAASEKFIKYVTECLSESNSEVVQNKAKRFLSLYHCNK